MRALLSAKVGALILGLLATTAGFGQPPGDGKKSPKAPPDEEKAILDQIKEAYKAQYEVDEDVLKELRKSYQQPTPEREAKIFKELRRLYVMTADQERDILREIRRAYDRPSPEQEERIFREISRAGRLPPGVVSPSVQVEQTMKLLAKLDQNGDGVLSPEEMPEGLRSERGRWDADRDGFISPDEYWPYYRGRLESLSQQVAAGQIDLGLKRGGPVVGSVPAVEEKPRPTVYRAGQLPQGLPDWFSKLDADRDAQLGLYEWKKSGRSLEEFSRMDRNGDGLVTVAELTRYLEQQPRKP
jgi:hypothetical protein